MSKEFEKFTFGEGKAPDWFNKEASGGRVKIIRDEDDGVIGAQILSGSKTYDAVVGDTIIRTRSGLAVVPREKAKAYGLQKKDEKQSKPISKEEKDPEE